MDKFLATVVTLFPEAFPGALGVSLIERARQSGKWSLDLVNLRDFGIGTHRSVDDTPAGGGAGMIIRPDVAASALDSIPDDGRARLYLSPRGKPFNQKMAREISRTSGLVLFCGRFEGLDQRVIDKRKLIEISVGDFVLAGGELGAQSIIESCVRLLPGVIGNNESIIDESFENELLEHPQYTIPRVWEGEKTPEILLSGNHGNIAKWRKTQAKHLTKSRRPDLWGKHKQFSGISNNGERS